MLDLWERGEGMTAEELRLHAAEIVKGYRNENTSRSYAANLELFVRWYEESGQVTIDKPVIQKYIDHLLQMVNSEQSINARVLAVSKICFRLAEHNYISAETWLFVSSIDRMRKDNTSSTVLSDNLARALIGAPDTSTAKGVRDRAIISVMLGCGLETSECVTLQHDQFRQHFFSGVVGRGGKRRDVLIPSWVQDSVSKWIEVSGINDGALFRGLWQNGTLRPRSMTPMAVFYLLREYAARMGTHIKPRDLRRTCFVLSERDEQAMSAEIAKLNRDVASLRRALNTKANLTPDRLRGAVMEHWDRRDLDQP